MSLVFVGEVESLVHDNAFDFIERKRQSLPEVKPFHKWFLAKGENCSVGVAGRGM